MAKKADETLETIDEALEQFERIRENDPGDNEKFTQYLDDAIRLLILEMRDEWKRKRSTKKAGRLQHNSFRESERK